MVKLRLRSFFCRRVKLAIGYAGRSQMLAIEYVRRFWLHWCRGRKIENGRVAGYVG
jgi:hypothetical protein